MSSNKAKAGEPESAQERPQLKEIKQGWGKRLFSTGKLAASAARLATRRLVGAEGKQDAILGEALASEMDKMKGMAMKVGQIISYFDGILPAQTHEALHSLQRGVTAVDVETMQKVLEEAFGQSLDALFEKFDPVSIASASIGQVYRGIYQGQQVAIKIQYPGVWETIRSDFSVLQRMTKVISLATAVDGPAIVNEIRARFGEECDYLQEAKNQNAFASVFANRDDIIIPRVYDERTRKTVLTSEWCDGKDFYSFVEDATLEEKNEVARLLMRFAYHSFFLLGHVNADPHPGNYLFPGDGRVVFLDFGCVASFEPDFVDQQRDLMRILIEDKRALFRDAVMATGMVPKPHKFDFDEHWEMMRYMAKPYCESHFQFTSAFIQGVSKYSGPSNPNLRHLAISPPWIWLQRLQWGLHAVLARLDASGNFQALLMELLQQPYTGMPALEAPPT